MVMIGKDIKYMANECKTNITKHTMEELRIPIENLAINFSVKLHRLSSDKEKAKLPLRIPIDSPYFEDSSADGHITKTRRDIDLQIGRELGNTLENYLATIHTAIKVLQTSSESQILNNKTFALMLVAIEDESKVHTKEIKELIERNAVLFDTAATYNDIVAYASTLNGQLREALKEMTPHLFEVACKRKETLGLRF